MSVDPYLRRAQEALDAAKVKAKSYRGDCSDCAHYRRGMFPECGHPAVHLVAFNLTDAYGKRRILQCAEQRDVESLFGPVVCGPDGALFEPRRPPKARRTLHEWLYDLFVGQQRGQEGPTSREGGTGGR